MKLYAFLNTVNEAKFRQPQIMYHGTSTANLRSILKNGVLPNPPGKVWDRDPGKDSHIFGLSSLEGSYWGSTINTASGAANKAARTFGGRPLLVIAQIQEASAFADEDDIRGWMERAVNNALVDLSLSPSTDLDMSIKNAAYFYYVQGTEEIKENLIKSYGTNLHNTLVKSEEAATRKPIDWTLMKRALEVVIAKRLAQEKAEYSDSVMSSHMIEMYNKKVEEKLAPPVLSVNDAISKHLDVLEELSRSYTDSALQQHASYAMTTLRINEPVSFRGANKILAIIESSPYVIPIEDRNPETLYYGIPPKQYFSDYNASVGVYPGAVNSQGKLVVPPESQSVSSVSEAIELSSPVDMWAYAIVVAEAYQKAPTIDPRASEAYKVLVVSTQRLFQQVNKMVNVQFTKDDPYKSPEDAAQDVIQNKNLSVFSGGSPHPVMSDEQNVMFRTIHDYYTHIGKNIGPSKRGERFKTHSFKFRGELNSYLTHTKLAPQKAIPALFTEVVGQLSYYVATGNFVQNKAAILDGFDYINLGRMSPERKQRYDQIVAQLQDKSQSHVDTEFGKISKDKIKWGLLSPGAGANREKILATVGGNEGERNEDPDPGLAANPEMLTPLKPGATDAGTASGWDWDDPQHGTGKEGSMNMLQDK